MVATVLLRVVTKILLPGAPHLKVAFRPSKSLSFSVHTSSRTRSSAPSHPSSCPDPCSCAQIRYFAPPPPARGFCAPAPTITTPYPPLHEPASTLLCTNLLLPLPSASIPSSAPSHPSSATDPLPAPEP
ncbi:hypothetical protein SLEP1_g10168 [Rubroshorea leprosula]|uniref:Uncharacterized protein n=1 Tax=Rubroshorea leprosula TaxID=152421 RepID=A0AAV5IGH9_9ROSI|nr:hypothetical protein SLEP1_g10168 [Rubroshorea leprosula]